MLVGNESAGVGFQSVDVWPSESIHKRSGVCKVTFSHVNEPTVTRPIAPPAYDVAIEIKEARGRRLWPVLTGWTATAALFFGSFWLVLRWLAQSVPLPPDF